MFRADGSERVLVEVVLNGSKTSGRVEPRTTLADFIRHELKAFGTHVGCEHGVCGACTVALDGRLARSCLVYAVQADGSSIETIEGIADISGKLSPLQEAFSKHHALQCGFCTAGIVMSSTHFLRENQKPTKEEVRHMLSGHICRCTGYYPIVSAILEVAQSAHKQEKDEKEGYREES